MPQDPGRNPSLLRATGFDDTVPARLLIMALVRRCRAGELYQMNTQQHCVGRSGAKIRMEKGDAPVQQVQNMCHAPPLPLSMYLSDVRKLAPPACRRRWYGAQMLHFRFCPSECLLSERRCGCVPLGKFGDVIADPFQGGGVPGTVEYNRYTGACHVCDLLSLIKFGSGGGGGGGGRGWG